MADAMLKDMQDLQSRSSSDTAQVPLVQDDPANAQIQPDLNLKPGMTGSVRDFSSAANDKEDYEAAPAKDVEEEDGDEGNADVDASVRATRQIGTAVSQGLDKLDDSNDLRHSQMMIEMGQQNRHLQVMNGTVRDMYGYMRRDAGKPEIETYKKDWTLLSYTANEHPFEGNNKTGSFADFYIFELVSKN